MRTSSCTLNKLVILVLVILTLSSCSSKATVKASFASKEAELSQQDSEQFIKVFKTMKLTDCYQYEKETASARDASLFGQPYSYCIYDRKGNIEHSIIIYPPLYFAPVMVDGKYYILDFYDEMWLTAKDILLRYFDHNQAFGYQDALTEITYLSPQGEEISSGCYLADGNHTVGEVLQLMGAESSDQTVINSLFADKELTVETEGCQTVYNGLQIRFIEFVDHRTLMPRPQNDLMMYIIRKAQ